MGKKIYLSFCFSLFFCLFFSSRLFGGNPGWVVYENEHIDYYFITDIGTVIYKTKKGFYSIDAESGKYTWKKEDLKNAQGSVMPVPRSPIILFYQRGNKDYVSRGGKGNLFAYNIQDGSALWEIDNIKEIPLWIFSNEQRGDILFLGAIYKNYKMVNTSGINTGAIYEYDNTCLYIINMLDGQIKIKQGPLWEKIKWEFSFESQSIFPQNIQKPIFTHDAVYFAFPRPCKIDLDTGKLLWWCADEKVINENPLNTNTSPQMSSDETTFYLVNGNILYAINKSDGSIKWKSPDNDYKVSELYEEGEKFYVKGENKEGNGYVNAVKRQDGSFVWGNPFRYKNFASNLLVLEDRLLLFSDQKLYTLSKEEGLIINDPAFNEFSEVARSIEMHPAGLVLKGTQHVAMVDTSSGEMKWHKYFEAPKASFWKLLAKDLVKSAILGAMAGAVTSQATYMSDWQKTSLALNLGSIFDNNYLDKITKRYSIKAEGINHMYILAKMEKGPGIVAVNLDTGEVSSEILLDWKIEDEKPDFQVDQLGYKLYQIKHNNFGSELRCFSF